MMGNVHGRWLSDTALGRIANMLLIAAVVALVGAFFTSSGGPYLVVASWVLLGIGAVLGLLDDVMARRFSQDRWILAILLLLLLAVCTKVIASAAHAAKIR